MKIVPVCEESAVPEYVLPDALRMEDGRMVADAAGWRTRRAEILELFRREMYGLRPAPLPFEARVVESGGAFGGLGRRDQVRLGFGKDVFLHLLIYRPAGLAAAAPVILGLNFDGNHTTTRDPLVFEASSWTDERSERGSQVSRWPIEDILSKGRAVATFYYGDAAPDDPEFWRNGVARVTAPGRSGLPGADEAGAVALWAWGLSRAMDYLVTQPDLDSARVMVAGHSRHGKTALWAAAEDARFSMAVANESGCAGAALARRRFGERGVSINAEFPHWFCANYRKYDEREDSLPVDQHQLIALSAPRPVYVASASEDLWADPKGEFLSASAAAPVYELLGQPAGLGPTWPPPATPVGGRIGYHLRPGDHDITAWDWEQFLAFAERHGV